MGFSSSIQFREPEEVLSAFINRKVEAFTIFCGRQFLFKGWGADELQNYLEVLSGADSNATYTLRVYEDIASAKDMKKVKSGTEDDGSFNFKFNEEIQGVYGRIRGIVGNNSTPSDINKVLDRLDKLEKTMNEPEEEEKTQIEKILDHPLTKQFAPLLLGMLSGAKPALPAISGIPVTSDKEVINELQQHDPDLYRHLDKLLQVAKSDPASFQNLVKMFD